MRLWDDYKNTIDEAKTGLNFVEFENAFGYEYIYLTGGNPNAKYAALVFDGAKTNANGLTFQTTNGSNIFLTNLANPSITIRHFAWIRWILSRISFCN